MKSPAILLLVCLVVLMPRFLPAQGGQAITPGNVDQQIPMLPDFSYAGYANGNAAIPTPPVDYDVTQFGAVGDGVTDDTDAFVDAIEAAEDADGGVVFIPAGTFVLSTYLRIEKSGVILRGAGRGHTVLHFLNPLELLKHEPDGTASFSGGMLEFEPPPAIEFLGDLTVSAAKGDTQIVYAPEPGSSPPVPGEWLGLRLDETASDALSDYLFGGLPALKGNVTDTGGKYDYWLEVAAVSGNTVSLVTPLHQPLDLDMTPDLRRLHFIEDVGVEHLSIEFDWTPQQPHHDELGYNGIQFQRVANFWVRDVDIVNFDNFIFVKSCVNGTIEDVHALDDASVPGLRRAHHIIDVTRSQHILTQHATSEAPAIHGTTVGKFTNHSVFRDLSFRNFKKDHHRSAPHFNLHARTVGIYEPGDSNSGAAQPWFSGGGDGGAHSGKYTFDFDFVIDYSQYTTQLQVPMGYGADGNFPGITIVGVRAVHGPTGTALPLGISGTFETGQKLSQLGTKPFLLDPYAWQYWERMGGAFGIETAEVHGAVTSQQTVFTLDYPAGWNAEDNTFTIVESSPGAWTGGFTSTTEVPEPTALPTPAWDPGAPASYTASYSFPGGIFDTTSATRTTATLAVDIDGDGYLNAVDAALFAASPFDLDLDTNIDLDDHDAFDSWYEHLVHVLDIGPGSGSGPRLDLHAFGLIGVEATLEITGAPGATVTLFLAEQAGSVELSPGVWSHLAPATVVLCDVFTLDSEGKAQVTYPMAGLPAAAGYFQVITEVGGTVTRASNALELEWPGPGGP